MADVPKLSLLSDGRVLLHIDPRAGGYVLGRSEIEGDFVPDLDLSPFKAQENGVSRRHAALIQYQQRLHLVDLESANGTFLGKRRLPPHSPVRLKDGDQVRLGTLMIVVSALTD